MKAILKNEVGNAKLYTLEKKNFIENRRAYQESWQSEFRRIVEEEFDTTDIFTGHLHCGSGKGYLIRESSKIKNVIVISLGRNTKSDLEPNLEKLAGFEDVRCIRNPERSSGIEVHRYQNIASRKFIYLLYCSDAIKFEMKWKELMDEFSEPVLAFFDEAHAMSNQLGMFQFKNPYFSNKSKHETYASAIKNRRGNLELSLETILSGGNKIILASGTLDEMIIDKLPFYKPTEVRKVAVVLIPPKQFIPKIMIKERELSLPQILSRIKNQRKKNLSSKVLVYCSNDRERRKIYNYLKGNLLTEKIYTWSCKIKKRVGPFNSKVAKESDVIVVINKIGRGFDCPEVDLVIVNRELSDKSSSTRESSFKFDEKVSNLKLQCQGRIRNGGEAIMKSKKKGSEGYYYDSIKRLNERILNKFKAIYMSNHIIDSSGKSLGIRLNARVVSPLNVFGPIIYGSVMHGFPENDDSFTTCLTFRKWLFQNLNRTVFGCITVSNSREYLRMLFDKPSNIDVECPKFCDFLIKIFYGLCELIINEWWIPVIAQTYELPEIKETPKCCGRYECIECKRKDKLLSEKDKEIKALREEIARLRS